MNKNLLKTFLVAVGLAAGTSAWAQEATTAFSQNFDPITPAGSSEVSTSPADYGFKVVEEHTDYSTTTVTNGKLTNTCGDYTDGSSGAEYVADFTAITGDCNVTISYLWETGNATGNNTRSFSETYVSDADGNKIVSIRYNGQPQKLYVNDNEATSLGRGGTYEVKIVIDTKLKTIASLKVGDAYETNSLPYMSESATDISRFGFNHKTQSRWSNTSSIDNVLITYEAAKVAIPYSVEFVNEDNEELQEALTGNIYDGESFEFGFHKYILKENVLYEANQNDEGAYYVGNVTSETPNVTINYAEKEIEGIPVYFADFGDEINSDKSSAIYLRASGGATTSTNKILEAIPANTLPDGIYTLELGNNRNRGAIVKVGDKEVGTLAKGSNSGVYVNTVLTDIEIKDGAAVTIVPGGSSYTDEVDYILAIKTGDITVPVSIAYSDGLATYTPSVALDFTKAKSIAAYTATVSGDKVNLTRVNTVAAGEGVLIRSLNGGATEEEIPVAAETVEKTADNMFVGTLTDIDALATKGDGVVNYILNDGDLGTGFYRANNQKVGAGKAYLSVPAASAAKISFFSLDGTVTAIEGVEAEAAEGDKVFYNLSGQRVENPAKGLYIVNGKKVIIK